MRLHNIKNGKRFVPTHFKRSIVVYYEPNTSRTDHLSAGTRRAAGGNPLILFPDHRTYCFCRLFLERRIRVTTHPARRARIVGIVRVHEISGKTGTGSLKGYWNWFAPCRDELRGAPV